MYRYVLVAALVIMCAWTLAFMTLDLCLCWYQPVGVVERSGQKTHVRGIRFWPKGLFRGKMHWPPLCYDVVWGDHSLNSDDWFKSHPNTIDHPCDGMIYIDEISFKRN